MTRKMNKKTRNVISGVLVGIASIFAVINFTDIPVDEVREFLFSTAIFFLGIVLLAFAAVVMFKLLVWIKNAVAHAIAPKEEDSEDDEHSTSAQDTSGVPGQEKPDKE